MRAVEQYHGEAWPREACGLLIGREQTDIITVEEWVPAPNLAPDAARRFTVDPLLVLSAERQAEKSGQSLVGLVHSHPDCPAIPSETDRLYATGWPGFVWWILRVNRGTTARHRCWYLRKDERFGELAIHWQ